MSPAERLLWQRIQRRASLLQPALAAALLRAFATIRDEMGDASLARAIEESADRVFDAVVTAAVLQVALQPVRDRLRKTIVDTVPYFVRDMPAPRKVAGRIGIGFDILNPRVIDAVKQVETRVMTKLVSNTRESVRQRVRAGLEAGENPRTIAKNLRSVVGLAPNQELAVRNLRRELETGEYASAARRELIDQRFNLQKLDALYASAARRELIDQRFNLQKLDALSESDKAARIDAIVERYRKNFVAFHAETVSRTATLDSLKLGQQLSWQAAIENGYVVGTVMKTWVGVMDSRERPSHRAMEGQTVRFDGVYSNGQEIPGDSEYNCRCISRMFVARE